MAAKKLTQNFFERHGGKIDFAGPDRCWLWTAAKKVKGYGQVNVGGKNRRAHREAYEAVNGPIPDGLVVRHKCDAPACVNPDHLELGTNADNTRDMMERGRNRCGRLKGSAHAMSKLAEVDIHHIRAAYVFRHPELGSTALGRKHGVSRATIGLIVSRKIWRHI
jgi:hypothetical protein